MNFTCRPPNVCLRIILEYSRLESRMAILQHTCFARQAAIVATEDKQLARWCGECRARCRRHCVWQVGNALPTALRQIPIRVIQIRAMSQRVALWNMQRHPAYQVKRIANSTGNTHHA